MSTLNLIAFDKYFEQLLINNGVETHVAYALNIIILLGIIAILAIIANYIVKFIIVKIIKRWVEKSDTDWDDIIYEKGVFNGLSQLAPALIMSFLFPIVLAEFPAWIKVIKIGTGIYIILVIQSVIMSFISAFQEIYNRLPISKERSIKGYIQVSKIIIYFIGTLLILATLLNTDFLKLLGGLGAMTAVLLFVFKDAIMGLIAGIQLSANDMLKIGDSIEMPNKGAEGVVIDISLSTVKVLNSNKTITTIPSYAMVSESFQNWRGLEISEGRRIKRFVNINVNCIHFCTDKEIDLYKKEPLLINFFETASLDGLTNLTIYRAYIEEYLQKNEKINTNMLLVVRYLQPGEHGLPLEVFCYTKAKDLLNHEKAQSEIFDHIYAVAGRFNVKFFQKFTGESKE